jgi:acetyl esterase/lipase
MGAYVPQGVTFTPDLVYREGSEAWKLDLYSPADRSGVPKPGLVFVHGGGFRAGDKRYRYSGDNPEAWFLQLLGDFAKSGYVVISINYRLVHEAIFPAQIEDVKTAVRWLRAHAMELNVDPARVGVFGHSAGAELAALAALTGAQAGLEGDGPYQGESSAVQAAVVAALATDRTGVRNLRNLIGYQLLLGPMPGLEERASEVTELAKRASLVSYVRPDGPPILIVHGTADFLPYSDVAVFVDAMRRMGANNLTLMAFHGEGHDAFYRNLPLTGPAVHAFFAKTLSHELPTPTPSTR